MFSQWFMLLMEAASVELADEHGRKIAPPHPMALCVTRHPPSCGYRYVPGEESRSTHIDLFCLAIPFGLLGLPFGFG